MWTNNESTVCSEITIASTAVGIIILVYRNHGIYERSIIGKLIFYTITCHVNSYEKKIVKLKTNKNTIPQRNIIYSKIIIIN